VAPDMYERYPYDELAVLPENHSVKIRINFYFKTTKNLQI
jgi:hypothetical protein